MATNKIIGGHIVSIFKSWSKLFALALFLCFFTGCGDGSGSSDDVANFPNTTGAPE